MDESAAYSRRVRSFYGLGVLHVLDRLIESFPDSPLPIQSQIIPRIIEGVEDLVVRANPASGKTLAYVVGVAERFHRFRTESAGRVAMIILPTVESCEKVLREFKRLSDPYIKTDLIAAAMPFPEWSNTSPNVVVATPDGALSFVEQCSNHQLPRFLVLDEVDLLLARGNQDNLKSLVAGVPDLCQCLVFSDEPSADVTDLKKYVRQNPFVITLTRDNCLVAELSPYNRRHYYIPCEEDDKCSWLLFYLEDRPLYCKVLVFTNSDDRISELQSFFEKSKSEIDYTYSVLRAGWIEEPSSTLERFNTLESGLLIVTDYTSSAANETMQVKKKAKKHSGQESDLMYDVFKDVDIVVHFDMPENYHGYKRRILCTARRTPRVGVSMSLACPSDKEVFEEIKTSLRSVDTLNSDVFVPFPSFGWLTDSGGVEGPLYSFEEVCRELGYGLKK